MPTKAPHEQVNKPPPSTDDPELVATDKDDGPHNTHIQRAPQQPAAIPASRAATLLATPEPGMSVAGKASMVKGMQQSVGNTRVGQLAQAGAPGPLVQRQPAEKEQAQQPAQHADQPAAASSASGNEDLKRVMAATILAEAAPGQSADIGWIYYNRVSEANGEEGLKGSSAFRGKGVWYQIWLYMLGDKTYASVHLPAQAEFKGYSTVKEFCTNNQFMQTSATRRASDVKRLVDAMFAKPKANPHKGWIGQGNIDDLNNKSDPRSLYWKQARAYYWLQQQGQVKQIYVKELRAGKQTQFIFDARSIEQYYKTHTLPASVPPYKGSE